MPDAEPRRRLPLGRFASLIYALAALLSAPSDYTERLDGGTGGAERMGALALTLADLLDWLSLYLVLAIGWTCAVRLGRAWSVHRGRAPAPLPPPATLLLSPGRR